MKSKIFSLSPVVSGKFSHSQIRSLGNKVILSLIVFLSFQSLLMAKDGYQINVKFNDAKDSSIFLCHYFGKGSTVFKDDSLKLNSKGEGLFKSDKK
ncbi:MAG: hypothetical protein IPH46_04445 [Bacteroidetes bacterium]|nr:hypothetical protein [Bacteroidota bacterium]